MNATTIFSKSININKAINRKIQINKIIAQNILKKITSNSKLKMYHLNNKYIR